MLNTTIGGRSITAITPPMERISLLFDSGLVPFSTIIVRIGRISMQNRNNLRNVRLMHFTNGYHKLRGRHGLNQVASGSRQTVVQYPLR